MFLQPDLFHKLILSWYMPAGQNDYINISYPLNNAWVSFVTLINT